jgi:hypothetical protein
METDPQKIIYPLKLLPLKWLKSCQKIGKNSPKINRNFVGKISYELRLPFYLFGGLDLGVNLIVSQNIFNV